MMSKEHTLFLRLASTVVVWLSLYLYTRDVLDANTSGIAERSTAKRIRVLLGYMIGNQCLIEGFFFMITFIELVCFAYVVDLEKSFKRDLKINQLAKN